MPLKKRPLKKYKPRGLFSDFYGVLPKTCPALKLRSGSAFTWVNRFQAGKANRKVTKVSHLATCIPELRVLGNRMQL